MNIIYKLISMKNQESHLDSITYCAGDTHFGSLWRRFPREQKSAKGTEVTGERGK